MIVARGQVDDAAYLPVNITREGRRAGTRFLEFFTVNIRNTRRAYAKAVGQFLAWCDERQRSLGSIEPMVVAAYVEQLTRELLFTGSYARRARAGTRLSARPGPTTRERQGHPIRRGGILK